MKDEIEKNQRINKSLKNNSKPGWGNQNSQAGSRKQDSLIESKTSEKTKLNLKRIDFQRIK